MSKGAEKLLKNRDKAIKGSRKVPAVSKSQYADSIGIPPQRLAKLTSGATPSLGEAIKLRNTLKIPVDAWAA